VLPRSCLTPSIGVNRRLTDRPGLFSAGAVLAAVAVSLAAVLGLTPGNPVRVAAGLTLFIALPGIGVELALLQPQAPRSPWERLAVIGALGVAASGLASIILVTVGIPITETSVGAACGFIALAGSFAFLLRRSSPEIRQHSLATARLALVLAFVMAGSVVGSTIGSHQGADQFTILAFEDPLGARIAVGNAAAQHGRIALPIIVESHEADAAEYQLWVVGRAPSPVFSLQPSERRVINVDVSGIRPGSIEIQLLKSGHLHRSLRLSSP